ncbi:MAG: hypothetical protein PHR82_02680 [Endomicrobiaceae bacterium]|nr:hypothetical protein [Endomicrobiaceae bacterium]
MKNFVFVILAMFLFSGIFAEPINNANTKKQILKLTELQKNKLEYFQMEFDSKISVLNKDLSLKRKLFSEELIKPGDKVDVLLLEQLADEIKYLATTVEQLWMDTELNIRNSMSYEQYAEFKSKQENQKNNKRK